MIELKNVSSGYGDRNIIKNIDLSFPTGQVTVLLGPNGSGKTTLIKTALGLIPKTAGEILYSSVNIEQLKPRDIARQAAYLSQYRNIPHITAGRMVLHGRFPYLSYPRRYRREDYEAVDAALRETDSLELKNCSMERLSGGQRQKIYLAMVLAQNTETVFMDEPTAYLDVKHQLEVMDAARALAQKGRAAVLVLHDLALALRTADRAVLLSEGGIRFQGSAEELFESGCLDKTFGVRLCRVDTDSGWQYYCEPERRE